MGVGENKSAEDVVLVHGRTPDRAGLRVLRVRGERLEVGEVRPLVEGRPIQGDVVSLKPRESFPLLCDVTVHLEAPAGRPAPPARPGGPPAVSSDSYRRGWQLIWGSDDVPEDESVLPN